jgi:hypothetical protein
MAPSPPARPNCPEEILRRALLRRRTELRKLWKNLISLECLERLNGLAPQVESFLSGPGTIRDWRFASRVTWIDCDASFWDSLRLIALAANTDYRSLNSGTDTLSPADLNRLPPSARLGVLIARYRCPLNIGLASESDLAEELLRQLMVPDRAKLEGGVEFDVDMVLLKLNLVGVRAMITRDLRFLDALNYFYELPRRSLYRMRANPRLLAFWLCIYAQLLCTPDW